MAAMSVFDLIASICIALGTIMIPADSFFPFEGPRFGTDWTCQLQGFLFTFGMGGSTGIYMCLSWYFVCSITLKMNPVKINWRVEPIMMLFSLFQALFFSIWILSKDMIHPLPNLSYCHIAIIPENCNLSNWYVCDWESEQYDDFLLLTAVLAYWNVVSSALLTVAMLIIIWTIIDKNKKIKEATAQLDLANGFNDNSTDTSDPIFELRQSRVVVFQALMYILAYWITWHFHFISFVSNGPLYTVDLLNSIFFPLQGFWNLLIFLYDKTFLVRHTDEECKTFWKAARKVLFHSDDTATMMLVNVPVLQLQNDQDQDGIFAPPEPEQDPNRRELSTFSLESVDPVEVSLPSEFRSVNDLSSNLSMPVGNESK